MYATIHYNTTLTLNMVMSDITALLTGETNLANLSTSVFQGDSFITATVPAGWTLWDDVSATVKVFRSPIYDDPTRFKYLWISGTGTTVSMEYYESWNNEAHTGVRVQRRNTSGTEVNLPIFIFAPNTESQLLITASANHVGFNYRRNNFQIYGEPTFLLSHSRTAPWDTVANAYDPVVITIMPLSTYLLAMTSSSYSSSQIFGKIKVPKDTTTDYSHAAASIDDRNPCLMNISSFYTTPYTNTSGSNSALSMLAQLNLGPTKIRGNTILPIGLNHAHVSSYVAVPGGDVSALCGLYITNRNSPFEQNDYIQVDGIKYRIWLLGDKNTSYAKLCVKEQ